MSETMGSEETPGADRQRVRSNSMWTLLSQSAILLATTAFSILLARNVSVDVFGVYAYAVSLFSVGAAFVAAGLAGLGVKAILQSGADQPQAVAAILVVRLGYAGVSYLALFLVSLSSGSKIVVGASAIALTALFFRAMEAPEIWFLAHLRSRPVAVARIAVTASVFALRLAAFASAPSVWTFLGLFVLEAAASGSLIMVLYLRSVRPNGLPWPGWVAVRALARRSMPLVVAGLGNQINLRADVVMIQAFLATESVGIYAVASRLSELAYFLPVLVMNSTLPLLLQVRNGGGREQYTRLLQSAYARAFWSGCALTVLVWSFGPTLIDWLFGAVYAPSADVLRIHILAAPFVFMGAVYTKWIIAEEYLWSSFLRHGLGAGLNVVLNLLLIPEFGLKGAAWATVASYVVANYLAALVGRSTREQGLRMTWAILAPFRAGYRLLRHRA